MIVVATTTNRTLAIYPVWCGFGWVVCEGPFRLVDDGLFTHFRGARRTHSRQQLERIIKRFQPAELVVEAFDHRQPPVQAIGRALVGVATERGIPVELHCRKKVQAAFAVMGATTRYEIAQVLARHFGRLKISLPEPRVVWKSEDRRLATFNAAALVIAHFHNGATALLDEKRNAA